MLGQTLACQPAAKQQEVLVKAFCSAGTLFQSFQTRESLKLQRPDSMMNEQYEKGGTALKLLGQDMHKEQFD